MDEAAVIKEEAESLLGKLEIQGAVETSSTEGIFSVNIDTQESGILIGHHGETLASFQLILSLILSKKVGKFIRIVVNVGDYRERREEQLREMATNAAKRAKETKQEVVLGNLSSWQRRIVHMTLAEDSEVVTQSQGEEPDRQLVIKPK